MAWERHIPLSGGAVGRASHGQPRLPGSRTASHTCARGGGDRSVGQRRQDGAGDVVADDEPRIAQALVGIGVVEIVLGVDVFRIQPGAAVPDDDAAQLFHGVLVRRDGASRVLEYEAEGEAGADGRVGEEIPVGGGNVVSELVQCAVGPGVKSEIGRQSIRSKLVGSILRVVLLDVCCLLFAVSSGDNAPVKCACSVEELQRERGCSMAIHGEDICFESSPRERPRR